MAEFNLNVSKEEIELVRKGFGWIVKKAFCSLRKIKVNDILILKNGEQILKCNVQEIIKEATISEIAEIKILNKDFKKCNPRKEFVAYLNKKFRRTSINEDVGILAIKIIVQ